MSTKISVATKVKMLRQQ